MALFGGSRRRERAEEEARQAQAQAQAEAYAEAQIQARVQARAAQEPRPHIVGGYPKTWEGQLQQLLHVVDVDGLLGLYQSLDGSGRYLLIEDFFVAFSEDHTLPVNQWLTRLNGSSDPYEKMLLGVIYQGPGWGQRGEGVASTVSDAAAQDFEGYLRAALDLLLDAGRALASTDVTPSLFAQSSGYAILAESRIDLSSSWRSIDPFNRHGLHKLGQQLDERWSGDSTIQLELAASIAEQAPPGSPGLVVVAEMVMARWEFLSIFHDLENSDCDLLSVRMEPVREMVRLAYKKLFKSGAEVDPKVEARHLSYFAWCLYWGDQDELAWECVQRLQGRVFAPVWTARGSDEPIAVFEDMRDYLIRNVALAGQ